MKTTLPLEMISDRNEAGAIFLISSGEYPMASMGSCRGNIASPRSSCLSRRPLPLKEVEITAISISLCNLAFPAAWEPNSISRCTRIFLSSNWFTREITMRLIFGFVLSILRILWFHLGIFLLQMHYTVWLTLRNLADNA